MGVTAGELPDHVPGTIPATVLDEDDFKIRADAFKDSGQSTMKFAQGPFGPVYGDNYRNLRHHSQKSRAYRRLKTHARKVGVTKNGIGADKGMIPPKAELLSNLVLSQ